MDYRCFIKIIEQPSSNPHPTLKIHTLSVYHFSFKLIMALGRSHCHPMGDIAICA